MIAIGIVNARMEREESGCSVLSVMKPAPAMRCAKEHIAICVMILLCLPILAIYVTFFAQAFVADGKLSLSNFRFLYTTIVMGQYTVPTMGPAFRNTVVFTLCVTACAVVISLMAGYALSRMRFTGRNFLQKLLLILRLFPGVLLLISILYVLMYTKLLNTLLGVVMVAIALRLPGSTFIIRNFFNDIPPRTSKTLRWWTAATV